MRNYQPRLPFADMPSAVEHSISVIRQRYNGLPYYGGFSGGKDSVVIKQLVKEAGVPCEWYYRVTTVDPPEVVRFIHDVHPDVRFVRSKKYNNMADMVESIIPTRGLRACCREFKEVTPPNGHILLVGVRAEESARRKALWRVFAEADKKMPTRLAPILFWTEADVWEFIEDRNLPYCSLYDEGFSRLGCVGCPMATRKQREKDLERWPAQRRMWYEGIRRAFMRRPEYWAKGNINSPEELWEWWIEDTAMPEALKKDSKNAQTGKEE